MKEKKMMDDKDYGRIADALAWNEVRKDAIEKARGAKSGERFYALIYWLGTMSKTARNEGLLALEEAVMENSAKILSEIGIEREIQMVGFLVTDGTDPDILLEIAIAHYWASNLQGEEALLYYMNVWGFFRIQAGEKWTPAMERLLLAHLPFEADGRYEQYEAYKKRMDAPKLAARRERFMNATPAFEVQWTLKKLLEDTIEQADDEKLCRVICGVDNEKLSIAFQGMSPAAKQKILSNISENICNSEWLVDWFAEDWEEMKGVSRRDVVTAFVSILDIFENVEKKLSLDVEEDFYSREQ